MLLLLVVICWGLPTILIKPILNHFQNSQDPIDPSYGRFVLWLALIGYPLGLIFLIIFITSSPN